MRNEHSATSSAVRVNDCFGKQIEPGAQFVAFELGWTEWKLALATEPGQKPRRRRLEARKLSALEGE